MIQWVDQCLTGPIDAIRIPAKNLLLAQGMAKEEGRPDPGVFCICSGAHVAELDLPLGKFPIAQTISKSLESVRPSSHKAVSRSEPSLCFPPHM